MATTVGATVRKTGGNQVIGAFTGMAVTLQTVDVDDAAFYSAGQPTRLTAPSTGWYVISAFIIIDKAVVNFGIKIDRNGESGGAIDIFAYSLGFQVPNLLLGNPGFNAAAIRRMAAGEYVEIYALNATATTLINITNGSTFSIAKLP